jgi:predicted 3-demethylubiquinone-9 3-methyltransferase (glyoxalase superfamily)
MQKIVPNLWFSNQAEEAARFYVDIFKDGRIIDVSHYSEAGQETHRQPAGSVMMVEFELQGQRFRALNGGIVFPYNEAVSFIIDCEDQAEVDYYWQKLSAVPSAEQCGWLKDKYGVIWQVVPRVLRELLADSDRPAADRTMVALQRMQKLDIAALQAAYDGV